MIVEDDVKIASFLSKGLKAEGYATVTISDGDEALVSVPAMGSDVDLVLLDLSPPGHLGYKIQIQIQDLQQLCRALICRS